MSEIDYYLNGWLILGFAAFGVIIIASVAVIVDAIINKPKKSHVLTLPEMIEKLHEKNIEQALYNKISDTFLSNYSKFPSKKEVKENSKKAEEVGSLLKFIGSFADHHDTSEETLLNFQKTLMEQNQEYKEEITQHINKSLKNKK